jgi:hypothetical protein
LAALESAHRSLALTAIVLALAGMVLGWREPLSAGLDEMAWWRGAMLIVAAAWGLATAALLAQLARVVRRRDSDPRTIWGRLAALQLIIGAICLAIVARGTAAQSLLLGLHGSLAASLVLAGLTALLGGLAWFKFHSDDVLQLIVSHTRQRDRATQLWWWGYLLCSALLLLGLVRIEGALEPNEPSAAGYEQSRDDRWHG